ncbi:CHASE2 domain-containing protein [Pseudomonas sp. X10]
MDRPSHPSPPPALVRLLPLWLRQALVKTLAGLVLGLVTAIVLVWLSHRVFPGLQAYGEDLGLRVSLYFERVASSVRGAVPARSDSDQFGYVFLDVDPELPAASPAVPALPSPSEQACAAYAEAVSTGQSASTPYARQLDCSSARPLNRYLLAALLGELQRRQAKLVILDLVLARESGIVAQAEDQALRQALDQADAARMPVLFAGPYEMYPSATPGQPGPVRLVMPLLLEDKPAVAQRAAVALPLPGQPLRRYPKCLPQATQGPWLPSLPYLAALTLGSSGYNCAELTAGAPADNAPRIVFSLPSQYTHLDEGVAPERARWAVYRGRYERCLAAHFWDSETAQCGQVATYRDKVVVIGVSNPLRRDRHYTPLGDMAGPEVVINAVRSFLAYPHQQDKSLGQLIAKKCLIVLWCGLPWLGYFAVRCYCFPTPAAPSRPLLANAWRMVMVGLTFSFAMLGVVGLALALSFAPEAPTPSLDVLVPVIAIAIDEYIEQMHRLVHAVEEHLGKLFGLSPQHH